MNKFAVKLLIESRRIIPNTDQSQWDNKAKEFVNGVNWAVDDLLKAIEEMENHDD